MKSFKKSFLFGLIVWVVPFIVAMLIYQLREFDRPLFESIMPISLCLVAVVMSNLYFKTVELNFVKEGIYLGIMWLIMCVVIDQAFFTWGLQKMNFIDYLKDIGITYLIIPVITIGTGWAEDIRFKKFIKWIPSAH